MLLIGTLMMGFWLSLVGGLQARFGHWGVDDHENRESCFVQVILMNS